MGGTRGERDEIDDLTTAILMLGTPGRPRDHRGRWSSWSTKQRPVCAAAEDAASQTGYLWASDRVIRTPTKVRLIIKSLVRGVAGCARLVLLSEMLAARLFVGEAGCGRTNQRGWRCLHINHQSLGFNAAPRRPRLTKRRVVLPHHSHPRPRKGPQCPQPEHSSTALSYSSKLPVVCRSSTQVIRPRVRARARNGPS